MSSGIVRELSNVRHVPSFFFDEKSKAFQLMNLARVHLICSGKFSSQKT